MTANGDPAHCAQTLTEQAFSPFLDGRFPKDLGRKGYLSIRRLLVPEAMNDDTHAEEIFDRALSKAYAFLHENGGEAVRSPQAWFLRICRNETIRYLIELSPRIPLESLLEGDEKYTRQPSRSQARLFQLLLDTIAELPPRHRELLRLDICECLSADEIQRKMGIRSTNYFRRLKSEAFKALRLAFKAIIEQGIDSLF